MSEDEIRQEILACPEFFTRDHWLLCDRCRPLRKQLKAVLWGFAKIEDLDFEVEHYFKICDKCSETYPAIVEYNRCSKCGNEKLRKELRPDAWR